MANGSAFILALHGEREEAISGVMKAGHDRFVEWASEKQVRVIDFAPIEAKELEVGNDPFRKNDNIPLSILGQMIWADVLIGEFDELFGSELSPTGE